MSENLRTRDLFRQALLFGKPARIPLVPGGGRKSTRERWHKEGLPENVEPWEITEFAYRTAGGTFSLPDAGPGFRFDHRMMPQFEEKVIERKETSQIVQDWKGNICEIGNEFTLEHLRSAIDFVTRRWIKCPVEGIEDWEGMKVRYDASDASRLPENPQEAGKAAMDGAGFVSVHVNGPFWQLREWCGFENLCMYFYDKPKLIAEMLEFWKEYISNILETVYEYCTPDMIHLSEDMAYKSFSMISPTMVREHLLPLYRHWGDIVRSHDTPIYAMDSDGFIGELIPIWMEAGINCCDPIEVAAGNDIVAFREEFGKEMAYCGGVDKRAMAKGGKVIEEEMKRIDPVIQDGGYIPGCDHGVPSDVSWPDFVAYVKMLAKATGWL
jgi:Uroporphyrinogen decarboxylase (URO-D)